MGAHTAVLHDYFSVIGQEVPQFGGTITQLHRHMRGTMKFDDVKSDTLNLRVSPAFKLALKAAANSEQRSMVNMLEVLVARYCDAEGITLPGQRPSRVHRAANRPHVKAVA